MKTPWSNRVDECRALFAREREQKIRQEIVEKLTDGLVLEVGCGTKELKKHLRNHEYIGLDLTREFKPTIQADAHMLPFRSSSIPNVCTKNVLQHLSDYRKALAEIIRVSSDTVVLAERIHNQPTRIIHVKPVLRRRFNPADLTKLLKKHGKVEFNISRNDRRIGIFTLKKLNKNKQ